MMRAWRAVTSKLSVKPSVNDLAHRDDRRHLRCDTVVLAPKVANLHVVSSSWWQVDVQFGISLVASDS